MRFVEESHRLWFEIGVMKHVFLMTAVSSGTGWVVRRQMLMLKLLQMMFLDLQLRIQKVARGCSLQCRNRRGIVEGLRGFQPGWRYRFDRRSHCGSLLSSCSISRNSRHRGRERYCGPGVQLISGWQYH